MISVYENCQLCPLTLMFNSMNCDVIVGGTVLKYLHVHVFYCWYGCMYLRTALWFINFIGIGIYRNSGTLPQIVFGGGLSLNYNRVRGTYYNPGIQLFSRYSAVLDKVCKLCSIFV